jgi:hypothetical protein
MLPRCKTVQLKFENLAQTTLRFSTLSYPQFDVIDDFFSVVLFIFSVLEVIDQTRYKLTFSQKLNLKNKISPYRSEQQEKIRRRINYGKLGCLYKQVKVT